MTDERPLATQGEVSAPVPIPTERLASLDALRGLSLLGIAMVNATMIAWPVSAQFIGKLPIVSTADRWADLVLQGLLQARVYPLFALLFGAGMGFLVLREATHGTPTRHTLWLRCAVLLLLGIGHGTLIWQGDVLTTHALVGFALLLGAGLSRRALLATSAALCGLLLVVLSAALAFTAFVVESDPELMGELMGELLAEFDAEARAITQGSWQELHAFRLAEWRKNLDALAFSLPPFLFSAAVGFVLVRDGFVGRALEAQAPWRRGARVGLWLSAGVAVLLMVCIAHGNLAPFGATQRALMMVQTFSGPVLAIALFSLAVITPELGRGRLGEALAATGRLSLTHYLSQSLLLTALLSGWGLGLQRELGLTGVVLLGALMWTVQLLGSRAWLARFHLGPAEWLWRTLASLERQPFLRAQPSDAAPARLG